jgi:resuscitation-promoting factor RpfB
VTAYRRSAYRYRSPYRRSSGAGKAAGVALGLFLAYSASKSAHGAAHHLQHRARPVHHAQLADVAGSGETAPSGNASLGASLASSYRWGSGSQWGCLYALWERESGWQNDIANPQSGAFGIAQALGHAGNGTAAVVPVVRYPGGYTASNVTVDEYPSRAANSGDARAQIAWGLGYIQGTYGTPCGAWAHEEADSWY